MDRKLKEILKSNKIDNDNDAFNTHISMLKPKGRYQFNRHALEEFWEIYCEYIQNNDAIAGIAEKPQQYLPLIVDVDLKVRDGSDKCYESLYDQEQLKTVVSIYQSVIKIVVDNLVEDELTCVVLEKELYIQKKGDSTYFKNGFHLHFPYIFLNRIVQETQIIPRVKDALKIRNLFEGLGIEDSGDVIDKNCCKVNWLLYGSKKTEDMKPYKVTKILTSQLEEINLEKAFKNYKIYDHKENLIPVKKKVEYYLPRILSIIPHGRDTKEQKYGIISPLKEKLKKEKKSSIVQAGDPSQCLETAKAMLPLISDSRASDYNDWMTIGWVLYNITDGSAEGRELWCEFSSRCGEKYNEDECIHIWDRMVKKDMTIKTLCYYAKLDNPEEYKNFCTQKSETYIHASLEGSHNDVAKALYAECGDDFVCASISNKTWYQFRGHKWEYIEEGVYLRRKISSREFMEKYTMTAKKLYEEISNSQDKAKDAMLNARLKQINKMIQNLKNSSYKNNVLKECMEVFYDPRFQDKLDLDPYLIAFKNGVYDLKNNLFRKGRPEDFLSKAMPVNYVEFSETDDKVNEVYNFFEKVFPDKSVRKYFMDVSSDIFVGGNHEKLALFWVGEGDNGKSVTQTIFEQMMGKLAIKLNTTVITGKKPSAGAAFADLSRAGGGVRWAVLEEPDGDEAINIGVLKLLTGNDTFFARDLFEKGKDAREIKSLFKLVFIANRLPRIKHADKAVWNRVRVIPFEATFANDAPDSHAEQMLQKKFPKDKEFSKKIPGLLEAFAWVLLEHRKKITTRFDPEKVRVATEQYQKQNDIYRQFIDENISPCEGKSISLAGLYAMFKEWFRESLPNQQIPIKNEFEEHFIKIWGHPSSGKIWKGYTYRISSPENDDEEVLLSRRPSLATTKIASISSDIEVDLDSVSRSSSKTPKRKQR